MVLWQRQRFVLPTSAHPGKAAPRSRRRPPRPHRAGQLRATAPSALTISSLAAPLLWWGPDQIAVLLPHPVLCQFSLPLTFDINTGTQSCGCCCSSAGNKCLCAVQSRVVSCSTCGNHAHEECFNKWTAQKRAAHQSVTCVYCRAPWPEAPAAGGTESGAYINLKALSAVRAM